MGYLNSETHEMVSLLQNNDGTTYKQYLALAKTCPNVDQLTEKLWESIQRNNPLKNDDSIYSIFLRLFLQKIDMSEIARFLIARQKDEESNL